MREHFEAFLEDLSLSKRRSQRTCQIYRQILNTFDKFLARTTSAPSEEVARAYLRCRSGAIEASTQALEVATLRQLSRFLERQNEIEKAWNLKAPRAVKKIIRVFSDEDVSILVKAVESQSDEQQVLFHLLYGSGLRISEALGLRLQNVNFYNHSLNVFGKGGKWRAVPLTKDAERLMAAATKSKVATDLWHSGVTYSVARKWVREWGRESGLDQKYGALHPHLLRHAIASHLLRRGGKLPHIQKMLGHSKLATTQKYTHLEIEDLMRAYDQAIPKKLVA